MEPERGEEGWSRDRRQATYREMGQISAHIKDNEKQVCHCQGKKVQIWRGRKLEFLVGLESEVFEPRIGGVGTWFSMDR